MTERVVPGGRPLLAVASVAVAFAAADTYVVVLALPDMMAAADLSAERLQRGAPIISGFLLGYVAVLPLIGRIADLRGRLPVLTGSLVIFAIGSLVTAAAYDLPSMVTGRFLQGLGGGGLVPATLALVADLYPPERRGMPLGVVGAVQELGSVLGPLYGAVVLVLGDWRDIFWVNLLVGALLVLALVQLRRRLDTHPAPTRPPWDWLGALVLSAVLACALLVMWQPSSLTSDVELGLAFLPVAGDGRWLSPLGIATAALMVVFVVRSRYAARPLVDFRRWGALAREVDLVAAGLMTVALGGVVLTFATAEPEREVLSPAAPWLLAVSAASAVAFAVRNRRGDRSLVPPGALRAAPAWGSLLVSFFVGSALIAAIVDIPTFARLTVHADSQVAAALVLVRFLVALPLGALAGGWLLAKLPAGVVAALGMGLACAGFIWMANWGLTSLDEAISNVPLVLAGLGFGLALAPVNAALLAATESAVHGLASALLVVARMVGMLVGISVLTTVGLRRYYAEQTDIPAPFEICGRGVTRCKEYTEQLQLAGIAQLQTVFVGAAVCAVVAAALSLVLLSSARTRGVRPRLLEGQLG